MNISIENKVRKNKKLTSIKKERCVYHNEIRVSAKYTKASGYCEIRSWNGMDFRLTGSFIVEQPTPPGGRNWQLIIPFLTGLSEKKALFKGVNFEAKSSFGALFSSQISGLSDFP